MRIKFIFALPGLTLAAVAAHAATPPDFEISGQVQVDSSFFDGAHNDQSKGSNSEVRRARLGLKHESKKGWEAEFEIDINEQDNEVGITDAYVRYVGWNFVDVTFGKMKEPFGLENTTGSKNISTIERSVVTEAFKPGRNFGALFSRAGNRYSFDLGGFRSSEDEQGLDSYAVTGRITLNPIRTETNLIHLGISGSERDMKGIEYRINEPLEVNSAASIIESARINADKIQQYSIEGALVLGSLSLQTEWLQQDVKEIATAEEPLGDGSYSGYYVLASLFLTGESRPYKAGSFGSVKPLSDVGAWELIGRYSDIELGDSVDDVRANTLLLGINYYATARAKLMLNVAKAEVERSNVSESGDGESATFRAQYAF